MNPFLAKVKYVKQQGDGSYKYVKEEYLINAHSFTDVEAVIYEQIGAHVKGELIILSINRYNIQDAIVKNNYEWFYLVKIKYTPMDDQGGRKQITNRLLVEASSIENANNEIIEYFDKFQVDYEKIEVKKTNIVEFLNSKLEAESVEDAEIVKYEQLN
jgi:hypothetical protein